MQNQTKNRDGQDSVEQDGILGRIVLLLDRGMPDPFVLVIGITVITIILSVLLAPRHTAPNIIGSWYEGYFKILLFTVQIVLVMINGFAIAESPPAQGALNRLSHWANTRTRIIVFVLPSIIIVSWLNWGIGMVFAAFLSREIAKRTKVDFAWLVAACFTSWLIANQNGLSSSVALAQATKGNPLNIVEHVTGKIVPLTDTIFGSFVFIPTVATIFLIPIVFYFLYPKKEEFFQPDALEIASDAAPAKTNATSHYFSRRVENSPIATIILVLIGALYVVFTGVEGKFSFDFNQMIMLITIIGLALHGNPMHYARSIRKGVSHTGAVLLQFPLYGGIFGIMTGTGLAIVIGKFFISVASPATLPLWNFVCAVFLDMLAPSSGGVWALLGPIFVPAAQGLHASMARVAMGPPFAAEAAPFLQPFWAAAIVSIAGVRLHKVMGYTVVMFVISVVMYALALWI